MTNHHFLVSLLFKLDPLPGFNQSNNFDCGSRWDLITVWKCRLSILIHCLVTRLSRHACFFGENWFCSEARSSNKYEQYQGTDGVNNGHFEQLAFWKWVSNLQKTFSIQMEVNFKSWLSYLIMSCFNKRSNRIN